jgi:Family of unknown function (DUF5895)
MTTNIKNKYLSNQYAATDFSFPYVQALRGEDPKQCGYFIPLSQADKAGWRDLDPQKLTEYAYNSGQTEVGILLKQPHMAITAVSALGMFDREASQKEESFVVIGKWDSQHRTSNVGNFQIYLVMFFDENKQPLHDIPLKLVAKGAHQATLSEQLQKFCVAVARCQAKANNVYFKPRNEVFNALCLFQPLIIRKAVGDKIKSPACYIDGFVAPTVDNWQDFFIGTNEELADLVLGMLNPRPRLLLADPTPGTSAKPMEAIGDLSPMEKPPQITATADRVIASDSPAIDIKSSIVAADYPNLDDENIPF